LCASGDRFKEEERDEKKEADRRPATRVSGRRHAAGVDHFASGSGRT
jgi:hypothetical protein